jgi:hypothetical protein
MKMACGAAHGVAKENFSDMLKGGDGFVEGIFVGARTKSKNAPD